MRRLIEPAKFAVVGGIAFVIDGTILSAILHFFPTAVLAARVPSFLVAATAAWWLHRKFTFAATGAHRPKVAQWFSFVTTNGIGNLINLVVYGLLVMAGGWHPLLALAAASLVAMVFNYSVSRFVVFRARPTQPR
jgi:putative flippase GtrA